MAPSLITFNKSHEKRLEEYKEILGSPLPPSQVFEQWCDYLDLGVEPTGWCGLWNISRELCEDFDIPFPCPVFVLVSFNCATCIALNSFIIVITTNNSAWYSLEFIILL